jgi:MFS family permease
VRHALAPVSALLIGVAILMTGSGLQTTLLPVRASLENFSTLSIGLIGAAYFTGFTLGCLKGGRLVRDVGHVRVFLAMTALGSASPLLQGLFLDPVAWSLLRFLTGFCFAVLFVVIESWLNERSDNENRGVVFSAYVMITLTLLAVGQMMTLLYSPAGLELFLIASVLVSLAAVPVALTTSATPEQPLEVDVQLGRLLRLSPSGVSGCLATGITNGAFWSLGPVFATAQSGDTSLAAWFMTAAVIGGALAQWPLGYVSDRIGRRESMVLGAGLGAVVALLIVLFAGRLGPAGVSLMGAAWGACALTMYAVAVAHTNDYAEPRDYVMVSSGLLLIYGVGAIAGPFMASAVMTAVGYKGLYLLTGVVHLGLAGYVLQRIFRREAVPAEQHIAFADALTAAHTASHVYEEEIMHEAEEPGRSL